MNVPAGTYNLEATFGGPFYGNNATDALLIQLHVLGSPLLTGLKLSAADVSASGLPISGLDALYVKLRTVGSITSYPSGDWTFESPVVSTFPSVVDFAGLNFGDVNGSNIPTGVKDVSFMSVVDDRTQTVLSGETFNYEVRSSKAAELGAMTLFMGYDKDRFDVVDVNTSFNDGMKYVIENGVVAIAWSDSKPMSVKNDDAIFTLSVTAKAQIDEPSQIFSVRAGSEFADPSGNRYDNFDLKLAKVVTPAAKEFSMYNFPNPFTNNTNIVYTLPESGKVRLVITNMFGQTLRTLVDDSQAAGTYTFTVNPADYNLTPGVYLYKIEAAGTTDTYVKINKMIFAR